MAHRIPRHRKASTLGMRETTRKPFAKANGRAMGWQAIGTYHNAVIWVRARRTGRWVAAVVPVPKSVVKTPPLDSPAGGMLLRAEFPSQRAACEAAMRYLEQGQAGRVQPAATPEGEEGVEGSALGPERRFERIPVSVPAIGWAPQFPGMELRGVVRYTAVGGLMAEFPVEVVPGSTLRVLFQTRQRSLEVEGKVVWTTVNKNTIRHGLSFPEPQSFEFLDEFFREDYR